MFVPKIQETEDAGKGLATPNAAAKREKGESARGQSPDSAQQKEDKENDKKEETGEVYATVQEKEKGRDEPTHKDAALSRFREKPNPIWQPEEVTLGKLLTDAQVTSEEHTSYEHHDEEETYGSGEIKHYAVAATNERIKGKQGANRFNPNKRDAKAELAKLLKKTKTTRSKEHDAKWEREVEHTKDEEERRWQTGRGYWKQKQDAAGQSESEEDMSLVSKASNKNSNKHDKTGPKYSGEIETAATIGRNILATRAIQTQNPGLP